MAVRPNISSMELNGQDLVVSGESVDPLPEILHVVVVQGDTTGGGAGFEVRRGPVDRISLGWQATLENTTFTKGKAEAMGIEVRVAPFEIRSWVQSLDIV